jgi:hypothetical protein
MSAQLFFHFLFRSKLIEKTACNFRAFCYCSRMATVSALPLYTETLGAALDAIREHFTAKGFIFTNPERFSDHWNGGISYETYKQGTFELGKAGKVKTYYLQVTLYRMPSGRYEIVAYVG